MPTKPRWRQMPRSLGPAPCWKSAPCSAARNPSPRSARHRCAHAQDRTCAMSVASCRPGARWKSQPPGNTTCCFPGLPAVAKPCWPRACRVCCRRWTNHRHWRRPRWPRQRAVNSTSAAGASAHSAPRTTLPARSRWWAVAASRVRGKSRWHITGSCSWTSCPSGSGARWKCCASRSNPARSPCPALPGNALFRLASSWWPP